MGEKATWLEVVGPIVRRFEVASAMNASAVFNADGSKAVASLLKKMATLLDEEIERRSTTLNKG